MEHQGTWLGITRSGRFAAVTNFRDARHTLSASESRGHLTTHFLTGNLNACQYLEQLEKQADNYNGFNLLIGDSSGFYYYSNRSKHAARKLKPGIYGLSNALLDTPWPKVEKAKAAIKHASRPGLNATALEQQLSVALLCEKEAPDTLLPDTGISQEWEKRLSACFIKMAQYGTRANTLLLQHRNGLTTLQERAYDAQGLFHTARYHLHTDINTG